VFAVQTLPAPWPTGVKERIPAAPLGRWVVDTNVLLDLWVYDDPLYQPLRHHLASGTVCWLATPRMREELWRVLAYPHIAARLLQHQRQALEVMAWFDARATLLPAAPPAPYRCKDPDDQPFIDLAAQHHSVLVSKDKAVLKLRNRLRRLDAWVLPPGELVANLNGLV
jgi:putative PIN family toxin of toxin-antitoxin system